MSWGSSHPGSYGATVQPSGPMRVTIQRQDQFTSWGFRLQGGTDYRQQLQIKKVNPNSPAHNRIHGGDLILNINGYDTAQLSHAQASQMIKSAGISLELTIQKGQFSAIKPTGPVKFSPGSAHQQGY